MRENKEFLPEGKTPWAAKAQPTAQEGATAADGTERIDYVRDCLQGGSAEWLSD